MPFIKVRFFDLFCELFLKSKSYLLDSINCVRWSPNGDTLATASVDKTIKIIDSKTMKVLYTKKTSEGSNFIMLNK